MAMFPSSDAPTKPVKLVWLHANIVTYVIKFIHMDFGLGNWQRNRSVCISLEAQFEDFNFEFPPVEIVQYRLRSKASVMKREVYSKTTLDSGLSWLVVLASFLSQFVVMGVHNVFGLLFIELLKEFNEGKATIGKSVFVFAVQNLR